VGLPTADQFPGAGRLRRAVPAAAPATAAAPAAAPAGGDQLTQALGQLVQLLQQLVQSLTGGAQGRRARRRAIRTRPVRRVPRARRRDGGGQRGQRPDAASVSPDGSASPRRAPPRRVGLGFRPAARRRRPRGGGLLSVRWDSARPSARRVSGLFGGGGGGSGGPLGGLFGGGGDDPLMFDLDGKGGRLRHHQEWARTSTATAPSSGTTSSRAPAC